MLKEKRIALPWPSSALVGEPALLMRDSDLHLAMEFQAAGRRRRARLLFAKQRAFRKRSEVHCTTWHVDDAFDTVCEVRSSDWARELCAATSLAWRNRWVMRHFMLYLDGFGCIEVIAESVSLALGADGGEPARRGAGL
jgi:hypothetical protein